MAFPRRAASSICRKNYLAEMKNLRNEYCLIRHGFSEANQAGIISCAPDASSGFKHGLAKAGQAQADQCHEDVLRLFPHADLKNTFIYASDFQRTRETAERLCAGLALDPEVLSLAPPLRERNFGSFNLTADLNYQRVWDADVDDEESLEELFGVESVREVQERATKFVSEIDAVHDDALLILVSHGDLLQILQTGFLGWNPCNHRSVPHLEPCEVRTARLEVK